MTTAVAPIALPQPQAQYSTKDQADTRAAIVRELRRCLKKDEETQLVRLVLKDTVTSTRYLITVASGVLTLTAL